MTRLRNNEYLKHELVRLVFGEGMNKTDAAKRVGVPDRSVREFFAKTKKWQQEWWEENQASYDEYFSGFGRTKSKSVEGTNNPKQQSKIVFPSGATINFNAQPGLGDKFECYNAVRTVVNHGDNRPLKIIQIADTQARPDIDLSYLSWIGRYIAEEKPDVVVHIGDHYDCPSLSTYDKGKRSFEGRRLKEDLDAGNRGMELLMKEFLPHCTPRLVFCLGNHEYRIDRLANDMPELDGFVGTDLLPLQKMGWEVIPFLKPIDIGGIFFVHYLANHFTNKPYSGTAANILSKVGRSFVVGHRQCLDIAIQPIIDGTHRIGIINGAGYPQDEEYKGYQGNNHFRGILKLEEVQNGFGLPCPVSLDNLKRKYG